MGCNMAQVFTKKGNTRGGAGVRREMMKECPEGR